MRLSNVSARQPRDSEGRIMAGKTVDDGWPLGGPSDAEIDRAREKEFERGMEAARSRWLDGDLTAYVYAVRLCGRHRQHPPRWLVEASKVMVERAMAEEEKRARREWAIHRARWEALVELRERRHELKERGDDRGMTWERAREAVSEELAHDEERGSERTIKASYELVEAAGGAQATFADFLKERRRRKPGQDAPD
jgi:hypothetical protein